MSTENKETFGTIFAREFKKNLTGGAGQNSFMAFYRRRLFVSAVVVSFVLITGLLTSAMYLLQPADWGQDAMPAYLLIAAIPAGYITYRLGKVLHRKLVTSLVPEDLTKRSS